MPVPRTRLLAFRAAAVILFLGMPGTASAATWWPSAGVFSRSTRVGLAADSEGGFLISDGIAGSEAAYCAPTANAFVVGGPAPPAGDGYLEGIRGGEVIPGSPSFQPDGTSIATFLFSPGLHTENAEAYEGEPATPAGLVSLRDKGGLLSGVVGGPSAGYAMSTGPHGNLALVGNDEGVISVARRAAGSSEWSRGNDPRRSAPFHDLLRKSEGVGRRWTRRHDGAREHVSAV